MSEKVSIIRCADYGDERVYEAVREAVMLLGGMGKFVRKNERILIKPNLLAGKPPEAAVTTHPSVVRAVITLVREAGAIPAVGDSPGIGSARRVAQKCGVMRVCAAEGVELVELKEAVRVENPSGHTFRRLEVAKEALAYDGIINVAKLKTHAQMFLTLGVKNLFGCVPGKIKPQWHLSAGVDTRQFAAMLLDLCQYLSPRLTVIDGVVAMEGNGPGSGNPRALGLIFGSASAVAVDAVIAEALGVTPEDLPVLKEARLRGITDADVSNIEVVGEDIDDVRVRGFSFPPKMSLNFAGRLPYFMDKRVRKALTSRPVINTGGCNLCGVCVDVCPAGVMGKTGRINIDYDRCIRCYCCQEMCPQGAISVKAGWLKRLMPGF